MEYNPTELIWRYQQQFLVHSFLYYELDESIISDHYYDWMCNTLYELMTHHPEEAKSLKYYELCKGIGKSGSGFFIKNYPPNIKTTALRLLWWKKKEEGLTEDFPHFIARWGFKVEGF